MKTIESEVITMISAFKRLYKWLKEHVKLYCVDIYHDPNWKGGIYQSPQDE